MRLKLFALLCFLSAALSAQIVNIEALRVKNDSSRWSGLENFSFSLVKNTSQLVTINNQLALQYLKGKHTALFLSDVNFSFTDNSDFERGGFGHLRYGYTLHERLTLEAFGQYQVNIPLRIEERILVGVGPRFGFVNKEKHQFFLGTLVMYEHDQELDSTLHNDARGSAYLAYTFKNEGAFAFSIITYYQPRLNYFEDYRLSMQSSLKFKIWKNFMFSVDGGLAYDAFPAAGSDIPNLTYKLTNGFSYSF